MLSERGQGRATRKRAREVCLCKQRRNGIPRRKTTCNSTVDCASFTSSPSIAEQQYRGSRIHRWLVTLIFVVVVVIIVRAVKKKRTENGTDSGNGKKLSLSFEGCIGKAWLARQFRVPDRTKLSIAREKFNSGPPHPPISALSDRKSHFMDTWLDRWSPMTRIETHFSLPPRFYDWCCLVSSFNVFLYFS